MGFKFSLSIIKIKIGGQTNLKVNVPNWQFHPIKTTQKCHISQKFRGLGEAETPVRAML